MNVSLPLARDARVEPLDAHLLSLGWLRAPTSDPALVRWSLAPGATQLDLLTEPTTGLRRVELRGPDAARWCAEVAAVVPVATPAYARGLLRASDPTDVALGLRLVAALRDPALAPDVVALTRHRDPTVRTAALDLARSLAPALASPSDDPADLFALTLDVQARRQVLRRLLRAAPGPTDAVVRTLRLALDDPDWEIRAGAMIAVARLGAVELAGPLERCALPTASRHGPVSEDRARLRALRAVALFRLSGRALPPLPDDARPRAVALARLYALVAGQDDGAADPLACFVASLTEPLDLSALPPDPLPPALVATDAGWLLRGTDLTLCYVPPVAHWLGGEGAPSGPLRRVTPRGFFIAELPLAAPDGSMQLVTRAEARARCEALSAASGARVRLPTGDEWEMAMRGPDGRRFPWGNGFECLWLAAPSPWGCLGAFGLAPQWLDSPDLAAGDDRVRPCAWRIERGAHDRAALRVLVEKNI